MPQNSKLFQRQKLDRARHDKVLRHGHQSYTNLTTLLQHTAQRHERTGLGHEGDGKAPAQTEPASYFAADSP